jgi:hypothetical protein
LFIFRFLDEYEKTISGYGQPKAVGPLFRQENLGALPAQLKSISV